MLGLIAGVCLATQRPFMGKATKRARVVFYSAEDPAEVLRWRLSRICRHMNIEPRDLDGWLVILDATDGDPTLFTEINDAGTRQGITTSAYTHLREIAEKNRADVFVIDNASDAYDADENQRARVRGFIRSLARLVKRQAGAVLLLAHIDKSAAKGFGNGEGYSGSTAWHNSVRSRLFLSAQDSGLLLEHQKSNLGRKAEPIRLDWAADGVIELASEVTAATGLIASGHRRAVLSLIEEFYDRGEYIPTSQNAPGNAYKVLCKEPGFPARMERDQLFRVLREAERAGALIRETYKTSNRKDRERWRVAPSAPTPRQVTPGAPGARVAHPAPTLSGGYGGRESAQPVGATLADQEGEEWL